MGHSAQTMYRIVFLLASAAALPVQVAPDGYGPSAVPYGPSPPSYAARPEPPRSYKVKSAYQEEVEEEEEKLTRSHINMNTASRTTIAKLPLPSLRLRTRW